MGTKARIAIAFSAVAAVLLWAGCDEPKESQAVSAIRDPARTAAGRTPDTRPTDSRETANVETETAMFGAGCFWGVEETFRNVKGVVETAVGYSGGHAESPSYKQVCTDGTGHAEVVQVKYDPSVVSYDELLDIFWNCHNPTTPNRQGPDIGSQYRSAIFYHTPEQEAAARASKERLEESGRFNRPIVTEITPASAFWRAEEYHQKYLLKHGRAACPSHGGP